MSTLVLLTVLQTEPPKVGKYRAVKDYTGGDVSVKKGATVFVIGGQRPDGTYQVREITQSY